MSQEMIKEDLKTLEIDESQDLNFKYLTAKYKKLAKLRHPDREGGNTEEFQKLSNAYCRFIKYIENNQKNEPFEETERDFETEFFMKHNIMKKCSASYVVYIQDDLVDQWRMILEKHIVVHKIDKGKSIFKTGEITITLYIRPKKDPRSKLHIQSGDQQKNMEFILEKLSMFYREARSMQRAVLTVVDFKEMQRSLCGKCGKNFTNKRGLKQHIKEENCK